MRKGREAEHSTEDKGVDSERAGGGSSGKRFRKGREAEHAAEDKGVDIERAGGVSSGTWTNSDIRKQSFSMKQFEKKVLGRCN